MNLKAVKRTWNRLGKTDPLYAVLTYKDKKGGGWNQDEFFRTGEIEVKKVMEYLETLGVTVARQRALDFGCGVGRITQALAAYFAQVHGVDIAPSMIELAKRYNRYGARCIYSLNTATDLGLFPDRSFDFILSKITLQHLEPEYTKIYLKEFLRILTKNGVLIFQLPTQPSSSHSQSPITFRQSLKRTLPPFLFNLYRRIKVALIPTIEMFGIPEVEVIHFLKEHGGKVYDRCPDQSAGDKWKSVLYCVTRDEFV